MWGSYISQTWAHILIPFSALPELVENFLMMLDDRFIIRNCYRYLEEWGKLGLVVCFLKVTGSLWQ